MRLRLPTIRPLLIHLSLSFSIQGPESTEPEQGNEAPGVVQGYPLSGESTYGYSLGFRKDSVRER